MFVVVNNGDGTCTTCHGYGLWDIGEDCPIGPMDAEDGYPTKPCPECGADFNSRYNGKKVDKNG